MPLSLPVWAADVLGPLGCMTSFGLCVAPLRALMKARKEDCLGGVDTRPYTMFYVVNMLWVGYTILCADLWNFISSAVPAVLWLYFCLTAIQLLSEEEGEFSSTVEEAAGHLPMSGFHTVQLFKATHEFRRLELRRVEYALSYGTGFAILAAFLLVPTRLPIITGIVLEVPQTSRVIVFRTLCLLGSLMCYGAPLARIYFLAKRRDASSIDPAFCLGQGVHNTIWFLFGLLRMDFALYVPQGIGVAAVIAQLTLKALFRDGPGDGDKSKENSRTNSAAFLDPADIQLEVPGVASKPSGQANDPSALEEGRAGKHRKLSEGRGAEGLPDLAPRLVELGMYEDYLKWQREYMRWRRGHHKGAQGDLVGGTDFSRAVNANEA